MFTCLACAHLTAAVVASGSLRVDFAEKHAHAHSKPIVVRKYLSSTKVRI